MNGWESRIGLVIQLALTLVAVVGLYWKLRELIFKLHGENQQHIATINARLEPLWDYFTHIAERSNRRERD